MDRRVLAIAAKDIKIILRDRMAFAMLLGMPVMLIIILSFALKSEFEEGDLELRLPIVDKDGSARSARMVELLAETEGVTVLERAPQDEEKVRNQVQDGDYVAALVIPSGFGDAVDSRVAPDLPLILNPGEGTSGGSEGVVRSVVLGAAQTLLSEEATGGGSESTPVKLDAQYTGETREPGVYEQNVPGFAILAGFFMTMFVAGGILAEKFLGTFRRLMTTPVTRSQVLLGKVLGSFAVGFVQMMLLFAFGAIVFGLSLGDQPLGIIPVTFGVVAAATGLGVLIAGFARTDQQATAFGTLIVLGLAALGGSMVPRFIMPDTMQTIALITPHAWAIDGYHEIIVQKEGLLSVLPHTAALLGFAAVFFAVGAWRFRFSLAPD